MFGLGTMINTGAVILGGLIGITLKKEIPEKCRCRVRRFYECLTDSRSIFYHTEFFIKK